MTNLVNLLPEYSYSDVLTTTNNGQGLTSTLKNLQDGAGNNSTVLIANNAIQFLYGGGNNLYLNNTPLMSSGDNINFSTQNNPIFQGNGCMTVPIGNTAQRPGVTNGGMRYNSQTNTFEFCENGAWGPIGAITSITGTANQITVTAAPAVTLGLANDIRGINSLATTNIGIDVNTGIITTNSAIPLILKPNSNSAVQIGANNFVNNLEIRGGSELILYSADGTTWGGWKCDIGPRNVLTIPSADGTAGQVLTNNGALGTIWLDQSISSINILVTQVAHSLSLGNIIRIQSDGTYVKAQANLEANAEVIGIVTTVIDPDNFKYSVSGIVSTVIAVTVGSVYFLDPANPGRIVSAKPNTSGQVVKPLLIASDAGHGIWINQRGNVLP